MTLEHQPVDIPWNGRLEERSKSLLNPDASEEELQSAGVMLNQGLFPADIVQHAQKMRNSPRVSINQIDGWNFTFVSLAHIAVVLHAMSTPDDPFTHLPVLCHLAQRPRTPFLAVLLAVFGSIFMTVGSSSAATVLNALDERGDCFESGGVRKMQFFPHTSGTFSIEGYLPGSESESRFDADEHISGTWDTWFSPSGDKLHNSFWRLQGLEDDRRKESIPVLREEYIQRCFDVLAVWFAISREAKKTQHAVHLRKSHHSSTIKELFAVILDGFTSLGDAFHLTGDPADDLFRAHRCATAVHEEEAAHDVIPTTLSCIPFMNRSFLDLPPELHLQILSYLPLQDLISLSMVCRSIHDECIVLMLEDPLSIMGELSTDSYDTRVYRRAQSMLEARPHLLHHVHRYTGYYNHLKPRDDTVNIGRDDEMRCPRGLDVRSSLASRLSRLNWVELDLWNLDYWRGDPNKAVHHALQVAQSCWPDIQHLELQVYLSEQLSRGLVGKYSTGYSCKPPSWSLRQLKITTHVFKDVVGIEKEPYPPIPLSSLLQASVTTLTCLELSVPTVTFEDVYNTPNLLHLSHLALPSAVPPSTVEVFLSRCPNLSSLQFGPWDWLDTVLDTDLDLSVCPKLESLHLCRTPYTISRLPASMRSIKAEIHSLSSLRLQVSNPEKASIFALGIKLELDTRSRTIDTLQELLEPLSKEFPKLSFLEFKTQGFYHGTDDQLVGLAKCASVQFPFLETFVINWRGFENNPRRVDFPSADSGQEARERRVVGRMFSECVALDVVALTGVPPLVHDDPHVHPRMVWTRAVDRSAVRTGRSAIRWMMDLDQVWK
ncbi:hypothetical protein L218DRAFT_992383 [Marasmius fiardii PR-910]|nr:hypothetical protein L218DRAFT_992383 [Marasmius fiardii PR-910]